MKSYFAILIIALVSAWPAVQSIDEYTFRKFISNSQSLKYGDNCSFEAEEIRQNYSRRIIDGNTAAVFSLARQIVQDDLKLCSGAELFVCDKKTSTCVCGDPGLEAQDGVNRENYVLEDGTKCRWKKQTPCVPTDFFKQQLEMGITVDSKCERNTRCANPSTGELCTLAQLVRTFSKKHGNQLEMKAVMKELTSGKFCSCLPTTDSRGRHLIFNTRTFSRIADNEDVETKPEEIREETKLPAIEQVEDDKSESITSQSTTFAPESSTTTTTEAEESVESFESEKDNSGITTKTEESTPSIITQPLSRRRRSMSRREVGKNLLSLSLAASTGIFPIAF